MNTQTQLNILKADLQKAFQHFKKLETQVRRLEQILQNSDRVANRKTTNQQSCRSFVPPQSTYSPFPITTQNRFSLLESETDFPPLPVPHNPSTYKPRVANKRKQAARRITTQNRNLSPPSPVDYAVTPTQTPQQVLLLADSHGRDMAHLLSGKLPSKYTVSGFFKPSGRLVDVISDLDSHTRTFTKRDTVIIIGGQNDINLGGKFQLEQHLPKLQKAAQKTNILFTSLPSWHNNAPLNNEIKHANMHLKQQLRSTTINLFDLHFLPASHFTRHGLHLNVTGKNALAARLARHLLTRKSQFPDYPIPVPTTQDHTSVISSSPLPIPTPTPNLVPALFPANSSPPLPTTAGPRYFLRSRAQCKINK